GIHLEHVRGNRTRFGYYLFGCHMEGGACECRRSRPTGPFAVEHLIGVALNVLRLIWIEAQTVADQLFKYRLMALTLRVRAGEQNYRAGTVEADFCTFGTRRAGTLDSVRKTKSEQFTALASLRLAGLKSLAVGKLEREIHVLFEFAAVIGERQGGLEWHGGGWDVIATPQFRRVHTKLGGRNVNHPFNDKSRLRSSIAAVGTHRIRVGKHRRYVDMDRRGSINTCKCAGVEHEGRHRMLQISADGGNGPHTEGKKLPLAIQRQFGLGDIVACLCVAQKGFRAGRYPLHRTADEFGGEQDERRFVKDRRLHSEASAGVSRDDADFTFRHLQQACEFGTCRVGALDRRIDRVTTIGAVVVADGAAR